jgi:hypothetical protein
VCIMYIKVVFIISFLCLPTNNDKKYLTMMNLMGVMF